jgi:hypothetical protein
MAVYFENNCKRTDKSFWNTMRPFMTNKSRGHQSSINLDENGDIITDPQKVSEIFNEFFITVASDIGFDDDIVSAADAISKHRYHSSIKKLLDHYGQIENQFEFSMVNVDTVTEKLKSINPKKATGFDNMPGKLIQIAHQELSVPICDLINRAIASRVFPDSLKCAEVSPLFKKEYTMSKCNFRPVSILTIISKIYEMILNDQMYEYFCERFDDLLSAYRKNYSCQTILLRLIEDVKSNLDQGYKVGLIFMDLSKAFDCIPHNLLIAKLHAYGLSITSCELMSSYLKDRRQRVKIGCHRSEWKYLSKGVPQGSILGPLLFNIFMNDLFLYMKKSKLFNYADDNALMYSGIDMDTVIYHLKSECVITINWFTENGMQANPSKFQFMVPSLSGGNFEITLNDSVTLKSENEVKALGVVIDSKLSFQQHTRKCCRKAGLQLNALARISRYIDVKAKSVLVSSFIMSNFNYCSIVWHFCGITNNTKLEKLQERSLRIIYKDYDSSYLELLGTTGNQTLATRRIKSILLEVFKSLNKLNAKCLHDLFILKDVPYNMRFQHIELPVRRTTRFGIRTFSYVGSHLWNYVISKENYLSHLTLDEFKQFLKRWPGPEMTHYPIPLL